MALRLVTGQVLLMVQMPVVELVVLLPVALGACASSQLVIVKEPAVAVVHHATLPCQRVLRHLPRIVPSDPCF